MSSWESDFCLWNECFDFIQFETTVQCANEWEERLLDYVAVRLFPWATAQILFFHQIQKSLE